MRVTGRTPTHRPLSRRGFCLPDLRRPTAEARPAMTTQPDTTPTGETISIPVRELLARLGSDDLTVVDVRPIAAFNGWRLAGETRGGHIPGAVAFPSAWLDTVDEAEIERELRTKGITPDRDVVIYDDGVGEAARVAAKLVALGITARHPRRWLACVGRHERRSPRAAAEPREARPHRLAQSRPRRRSARSSAGRSMACLPRELRRTRGVRGRPPARCHVPRHELARRIRQTGTAGRPMSSKRPCGHSASATTRR